MIEFDELHEDSENPTNFSRNAIADFLFEHLDEYGDKREHILLSIGYAYGDQAGQDGLIILAHDDDKIVGACIINHTNMSGYIPENILVYVAVHADYRGRGLGKKLMEQVIEKTEGDVALHVEDQNPAKFLYEKYGFEEKYLEMRLNK